MTQEEIDNLKEGDEFYLRRNTIKASYHKCIVVEIKRNTHNNTRYILVYIIKGYGASVESIYRGDFSDNIIFIKKIDLLLYIKNIGVRMSFQVEEEYKRSLSEEAEYWV